MRPFVARLIDSASRVISRISWQSVRSLFNNGIYWDLTEQEQRDIRSLLSENYFIILNRRKSHLSSYLIALAHWIKTGKMGYWSHVLMNLEDEVQSDYDFRLIEAVGIHGVRYASFMQVFDCDSVVLLKPKHYSRSEWLQIMEKAKSYYGRPYDTLFDLVSDTSLSCVELVRNALKEDPLYSERFKNFEAMISKYKNLTPDMFYECEDFDIVYETRH
jgi:hypothetical protein